MDTRNQVAVEAVIRPQAAGRSVKFTLHAHQEMLEEDISSSELLTSLENCTLIENYPDHKRGACCLVCGPGGMGRMLHVVCASEAAEVIFITVYEPKPPKWETPFKRGMRI